MSKYTSEQARIERQFGLHSNIPACCVEHFVRLKQVGIDLPGSYMDKCFPSLVSNLELQYVPCYECAEKIVAGQIVPATVHQCDPALSAECYEQLKQFNPSRLTCDPALRPTT